MSSTIYIAFKIDTSTLAGGGNSIDSARGISHPPYAWKPKGAPNWAKVTDDTDLKKAPKVHNGDTVRIVTVPKVGSNEEDLGLAPVALVAMEWHPDANDNTQSQAEGKPIETIMETGSLKPISDPSFLSSYENPVYYDFVGNPSGWKKWANTNYTVDEFTPNTKTGEVYLPHLDFTIEHHSGTFRYGLVMAFKHASDAKPSYFWWDPYLNLLPS